MSSFQMKPQDQAVIKALSGNDKCADCDESNPTWAAVSHGILLCIQHSGAHRALGTHLSFVRSVEMDSWSEAQIKAMKMGGNDACNAFLETHGVDTHSGNVRAKYSSPAAQLYKNVIQARVEGKPEPTKLPPPIQTQPTRKKAKMEGIGSSSRPRRPQDKNWWTSVPSRVIVVGGLAVAAIAFFFRAV